MATDGLCLGMREQIVNAVIEPYASGHHASYVKWAVGGLLAAGRQVVVVTTAAAAEHPTMRATAALAGVTMLTLPEVPAIAVSGSGRYP